MEFIGKSRVCVICGGTTEDNVVIHDDPSKLSKGFNPAVEDGGTTEESQFLNGISVFCDLMKIDPGFGTSERWAEDLTGAREGGTDDVGGDNLFRCVCCNGCGGLLGELATLQALMRQTQVALEEKVDEVEEKIFKSWEDAAEYSLSTCVEFRGAVLKNYTKRSKAVFEESNKDFECRSREGQLEKSEAEYSPENDDAKCSQTSGGIGTRLKLNQCFVKVERLNDSRLPLLFKNNKRQTRDIGPTTKPSFSMEGRFIPNILKRSRGRPRKTAVSSAFEVKADIDSGSVSYCENKDDNDIKSPGSDNDSDFQVPIETFSLDSPSLTSDEEYLPSSTLSSKVSTEKTRKIVLNRSKPINQKKMRMNRQPRAEAKKVHKLKKVHELKWRKLVYTLNSNSGIYSYMNVRLENSGSALYCRYPGCSFSITSMNSMSHFPDQDGFGCMKSHVETTHRISGEPFIYMCLYCDSQLNLNSTFQYPLVKDHVDQVHLPRPSVKVLCEVCGKSVYSSALPVHSLTHKNKYELTEAGVTNKSRALIEPQVSMTPEGNSKTTTDVYAQWRTRPSVFVMDAERGKYMFLYVQIERKGSTLNCRYPKCNFVVENVAYFSEQEGFQKIRDHVKECHRARGTSAVHECFCCDAQFSKSSLVSAHMKNVHGHRPQLLYTLCEICMRSIKPSGLMRHMRRHRNKGMKKKSAASSSLEKRKIKKLSTSCTCDECGLVVRDSITLRRHKENHLIPVELRKVHRCDMCPAKYVTPFDLKNHKKVVHFNIQLTPHVCPICGREYPKSQKTAFDVHVRTHSGEKPYQCSTCGTSLTSKSRLTRHEKTHKDLTFQCEFCSRTYKNRDGLRFHQRKRHAEALERQS